MSTYQQDPHPDGSYSGESGEQRQKRERMVKDVVENIMRPGDRPTVPNDLERLLNKFFTTTAQVHVQMAPKIREAFESPIIQLNAHSEDGRKRLKMEAFQLLLDCYKQFNRDETLFLLAMAMSQKLIEENM